MTVVIIHFDISGKTIDISDRSSAKRIRKLRFAVPSGYRPFPAVPAKEEKLQPAAWALSWTDPLQTPALSEREPQAKCELSAAAFVTERERVREGQRPGGGRAFCPIPPRTATEYSISAKIFNYKLCYSINKRKPLNKETEYYIVYLNTKRTKTRQTAVPSIDTGPARCLPQSEERDHGLQIRH